MYTYQYIGGNRVSSTRVSELLHGQLDFLRIQLPKLTARSVERRGEGRGGEGRGGEERGEESERYIYMYIAAVQNYGRYM